MKTKRIVVTGGGGFIGSHLAEKLLHDGHHVKVLDNFSNGNPNNIRHLFNYKNFKLIRDDVTNRESMRRVLSGVDVVFHLAAEIHVDKSIADSQSTFSVNTMGTLNILDSALENDVELVVYASTSEAYGSAEYVPMDEKHPLNPASPYAASKVAGDRLCFAYHNTYQLPVVIVRSFNTYGPRQADNGYSAVIPKFIRRAIQGTPLVIYGDGRQTRDFMYVKDSVKGYSAILQGYKKVLGKAVNLGTGHETSILELARLISKNGYHGRSVKPVFVAPRAGEVKRLCADTTLARKELGFVPDYDIEKGVKEFIKWYKEGKYEEWAAYIMDDRYETFRV